ncbi:MAG: autotransporter-associated beta strand repeat-containing protein, partial [Burkholderiales bacterium]|nr:autotransporter-associated beta strand repeat-containing protein [Burkholderiales bacterium]
LNGATVNANLGTGALTSNGAVALNGTSAAGTVNVASGTLTLGAPGRLTGLPATAVNTAARLVLAGNETLAGLTGAGNVDLGAATLALQCATSCDFAGVIGGSGGLSNQGPGSQGLSGVNTYTGATTVVAGTLRLSGAERLASATTLSIASGAGLQLDAAQHVASLDVSGTLSGAGTVTAPTYALNNGAVVTANLGAGALTSNGNVALGGTAAAGTVSVATGTLSLGSADRLADTAAVSIASAATLQLNGNDTVGSLTTAGTLARTGAGDTLTAATTTASNGAHLVANLGSGTLDTSGNVLLSGNAGVQTLRVNGGTLQLDGSNQLGDAPAATLAAGATLALSGDQSLGSLAGAGAIASTGGTLSVGSRGDSQYDGVYSGSGQLRKDGSGTLILAGNNSYSGATTIAAGTLQLGTGATSGTLGSGGAIANACLLRVNRSDSLTLANAIGGSGALAQSGSGTLVLTGSNSYTGTTTIAAGTLQVGADGTQGNLGSGAVSNAGLLRLQRSDAVSLSQTVTGTGSVEQAGTGTLTLDTALQTTGTTKVSRGSLVTPGDERIANGSSVIVDAGAVLKLGGNETLAALTSAGNVELKGNLTSSGDVKVSGTLGLTGTGAQSLTVSHLEANNAGNTLGSQALSLNAQSVQLKTGDTAALKLGTVNLAADSSISAGTIALTGDVTLTGGTATLVAAAAPAQYTPEAGKQAANGQQIAIADATISQTGGLIRATGGALALQAKGGGSILLLDGAANDLSGGISAVSGTAGSAWNANSATNVTQQSRISLSGDTVRVNGAGVEGDLITLDAAKLSTASNTSVIRARLPYSPQIGFAVQLPGLTLKMRDAAFTQTYSFGGPGDGNALATDVGSSATIAPSGFVTVLPKKPTALGSTAIYVSGPPAGTNGYRLFYDGASRKSEVPLVYNGAAPSTPEAQGSISATVAVSEGARKDRFEEAVRTENVAIRLRSGVIAEVGAGRPATVGREGIRPPEGCNPTAELGCEK